MKQLSEFPNYTIDENGIIYSLNGNIRKPVYNKKVGYNYLVLRKNGRYYGRRVARLVAMNLLPNPDNKEQVNHIDGIKTNDHPSNLEWVTASENVRHCVDILGKQIGSSHALGKTGYKSNIGHPVIQLSKDGFILNDYGSIREAVRETGIPKSTIQKVLNGGTKYAGGFLWM